MSIFSSHPGRRNFLARITRFGRDRRGNIGVIAALLMIPLVGTMGIAAETSSWFMIKRSIQNAVDSAAVAYATSVNAGTTPAQAQQEAKAVAARYGYVNGVNNTVISFPPTGLSCGPGTPCPAVKITKTVPVYLAKIVGFAGSTELIAAQAVARNNSAALSYCLFALTSGGGGLSGGGGTLNGCNIRSNAGATCTGSFGAGRTVTSSSSSNDCGGGTVNSMPVLGDPYAPRASNIPTNICGSPGVINLSGPIPDNVPQCGTVVLTGNVTVSNPSDRLVIVNGDLNLNGHDLVTNGGGLTIIFTGTSGGHIIGGGTLNISAPISGIWSGVAIYQDPAMPAPAVTLGSPTWDITGLVYYPTANVSFNAVVSAPSSAYCFVLVASSIIVNGGGIYPNAIAQCAQAGLIAPIDAVNASTARVMLVQ